VRRLLPLIGLLLVGTLLAACSDDGLTSGDERVEPAEQASPAGAEADRTDDKCEPGTEVEAIEQRDVAYTEVDGVDPNLLSLDLDVPAHDACEPPPVVVFVHGGGWRQGDKDGAAIEQKRTLFTEAGYAFATVNYRLSPEPHDLSDPDRVTYPTHPQDVADALSYLDQQAEELAIDAGRFGLIGHSAGAGIVSTLGTDASFLEDAGLDPANIACTVSLDTEAYDVAAGAEAPGMVGLTYQNAFTEDPEVWAEASPVNHVEGDEAPFLVITRGTPGRVAMANAFTDQLAAAGDEATVLDASPYTHDDVNRLLGSTGEDVITPVVTGFFADCLG